MLFSAVASGISTFTRISDTINLMTASQLADKLVKQLHDTTRFLTFGNSLI